MASAVPAPAWTSVRSFSQERIQPTAPSRSSSRAGSHAIDLPGTVQPTPAPFWDAPPSYQDIAAHPIIQKK